MSKAGNERLRERYASAAVHAERAGDLTEALRHWEQAASLALGKPRLLAYYKENITRLRGSVRRNPSRKRKSMASRRYSKPTAKQKKFIGRKIPLLMDEGYPQRQAIAISYSMAGVKPRGARRNPISEADEAATSKEAALENLAAQVRQGETMGVIGMYERAARSAGASYAEIERTIVDAKRRRNPRKNTMKSRGARRNPYEKLSDEARELSLYAENDGDLHRQMVVPIQKNLARKIKKGTYDRTLALKAWGYLMETAAKKYVKEYGGGSWYAIFPVPARKEAAQLFRDDFEAEVKAGGVEQYLK